MPSLDNFVLDSYAMIGYLENEPFAEQIEEILNIAKKSDSRLYLHAIHLSLKQCVQFSLIPEQDMQAPVIYDYVYPNLQA